MLPQSSCWWMHGAKLDIPNNRGITPVMAAAGMGSSDADTRGYYTTDDTRAEIRRYAEDSSGCRRRREFEESPGADTPSRGREMGMERGRAAPRGSWRRPVREISTSETEGSQEKTVIDSAMGRNGGNSRGGARIDVHEDTAKLLEELMKKAAAK